VVPQFLQQALAEVGPCHVEQVTKKRFEVVYIDPASSDLVARLESSFSKLQLFHERQVWATWIKRGQATEKPRVLRQSDWLNVLVPSDSDAERAMLALRKQTRAVHDKKVLWAIFTKVDLLTSGYAERTFRRKKMLPNINQAVAILCEDRNRKYVRTPIMLEWIISRLYNGGPFADLLYHEGVIDQFTAIHLASSWQARRCELQRRAAKRSNRKRGKNPLVRARAYDRLKITRSRRLDQTGDQRCPQGYVGFRVQRLSYPRPD
jgi:hypothetical protein